MDKSKKKSIADFAVTTVFLGLLIYGAYSLWYIFYGKDSGIDVHLYTVLSGSALGWFMIMFVQSVFRKTGLILKILVFLAGNGLFQGLIWGINGKVNTTGIDNDVVIIRTFTVVFTISAVLLLIAFILRAKSIHKIASIVFAIVYFVVSCGGVYVFNQDNIKAIEYKKEISFDTLTAEEMNITDKENDKIIQWFNENLYGNNGDDTFSNVFTCYFKVDGEEFNPDEWERLQYLPDSEDYIDKFVLRNNEKGLEVTVEAKLFEENATCQWTVFIKNTGKENSGVISDFYALDSSFSTGDAEVYYSIGSDTSASDFSLTKKNLTSVERKFSGNDGKPTEKYLPYLNINGENGGIMLGIGWTGQWAASLSEKDGTTDISVKQENFEAYLLPGEEVRSPLVSISFYDNTNPLKGFNLFRKWITDCVYPENVT